MSHIFYTEDMGLFINITVGNIAADTHGASAQATIKNKKQTTKKSSAQHYTLKAEGTGFEPADTLRYRQFSKLLV